MKIRFSQFAVITLVVATFIIYAPSLDNDFIWDDGMVIVKNDFVKSWNNFPKLFTRDYLASPSDIYGGLGVRPIGAGELTYRPVVTFTYFLDHSLWGLRPFGYHLMNLILHILSAVVMYYLALKLIKNERLSLFAALVFALHPAQAEAVCNISFREDILAFLFFAGAFLLYIRTDAVPGKRKTLTYLASLALFFLSLFSKEMAITLPVILLLYDRYFVFDGKKGEFVNRIKTRYFGFLAVALFYLWVWFFPMAKKTEVIASYAGGNFYLNMLTMAKVFATYIYWLLVPFGIHATIPDSGIVASSFFSLEVIISVTVLILCFITMFRSRRGYRLMSFGIIWFFITLFPVSNIFPIQNIIASRYLYIPIAGFCFVLASGLEFFISRYGLLKSDRIRAGLLSAPLALLLFYGILTLTQGYIWENAITFRREMVRFYPKSVWTRRMLGVVLADQGCYDEAIEQHKIAKELNPGDPDNYYNLGELYLVKRMLDEATIEFRGVIERDPKRTDAYYNLGVLYHQLGDLEKARKMREKIITIDPDFKYLGK